MGTQPHLPYALPEGLRYYLLRGSAMVPLVPVDQLPFQLQGVPRQLSHRQMSDEAWKYLTETEEAPSAIPIQAPTATFSPQSPAKPRFLAPDHHVRTDSLATQADTPRITRWALSGTENVAELPRSAPMAGSERQSSLTDTFASIYQKDAQRLGYRTPYPSGIEPDQLKKEFCTHWIKTGECAFMSIGCKYKHEMPTVEKLRELGFTQGMPRWWKEKSAIAARGPTWMQRRLAQGNDEGEIPAPRAFPDPSTLRTRQADDRGALHDSIQQPSGSLRTEPMAKATTFSRLIAPTPALVPIPPDSQSSNLLIDIDETPAPPPSPQPSNGSSVSDGSCDMHVPSSRTSLSPPLSPIMQNDPSLATDIMASTMENKRKENEVKTKPTLRRHSQISCSSDSEEDIKPTKALSKSKPNSRRPARRSTAPAKPSGLASSKHAASTPTKNADKHGRNSNRKTAQQKSSGVAAPELHAKIELLRREKDKARKSTVTHHEGQGRAAVSTAASVIQAAI